MYRKTNSILFSFLILISFSLFASSETHTKTALNLFLHEEQTYLALSFENEEHWHTYWKNPGDAGLAAKFKFEQNGTELFPTAQNWPIPRRFIEQGNIIAYGYEGLHTFFFKLNEANLESFQKEFKLTATWLICENICIPGKIEYLGKIKDNNIITSQNTLNIDQASLAEQFNKLPKKIELPELEIYLNNDEQKDKTLVLNYSIKNHQESDLAANLNLLTPYLTQPFGFKREELFYDQEHKTLYGKMTIEWDGEYQDPEIPLPKNGIFKSPFELSFLVNSKKGIGIVSKSFDSFSLLGQKQLNLFYNSLSTNNSEEKNETSFLMYLLFAFLGGLILNLMPCVLPVISLKLFGLISHQGQSNARILKHNIAYTLGVIISFIGLALTVYLLKASGEQIGWGFQMQSPAFLIFMIIVLEVMAINLFGIFEFRTPGGSLGGKTLKDSFVGDFFSGVIATILSTPCSAPFLGAAITFAFTTTTFNIFGIFIMVGIGLSFPFILTGFFPSLISFLPKPGAWMNNLKKFLGFTLVLTIIWLSDVFSSLVDIKIVGIYFYTLLATIFFAFFVAYKMLPKAKARFIFFLIPLLLMVKIQKDKLLSYEPLFDDSAQIGKLHWKKWSPEIIKQAQDENKVVFIDFTAKWCLTCKVNKQVVFNTSDFEDLVQDNNIELYVADWTKRDPIISKFLNTNKAAGVPIYFLINKKGNLINLGETISINKIKNAL